MPTIELAVGSVHYRDLGPDHPSAPVAVFVHGFLVDGSLWERVAERLADDGVRCIVPDWPLGAHRIPAAPASDLSPTGVAAGVVELLERLDLQGVVLVGNDTGGAICQLALRDGTSRIGGLVLTNCDAFDQFPPRPLVPLFVLARRRVALWTFLQPTRIRAVRDSFLGFGPLLNHPIPKGATRRWIQPLLEDSAIRHDVVRFARGLQRTELIDSTKWLRRFDRPVQIVWGTRDRMFKVGLGRRLAEAFPTADVREVDDASTFVPFDRPEAVVEAIQSLVTKASA